MDIQSYILAKRYVDESLEGAGALSGKSAYEIAVLNGFSGTEKEWLDSLNGETPKIGPNGTWIVDGEDTGLIASPDLTNYYTKEEIDNISMNGANIQALSKEEIEEILKGE